MIVKGCIISTQPDFYIVTVAGGKRYKARSIRGCFKAANGRMPKGEKELGRFIKKVVYGEGEGQ